MKSYQELVTDFTRNIKAVVASYQQRFTAGTMSVHRESDCEQLLAAVENYSEDAYQLKASIEAIMSEMKTGWFFFRTGKSTLKKNIKAILAQEQFSDNAFLRHQLSDLQTEVQEMRFRPEYHPTLLKLKQTLQEKEYRIAELEAMNTHLEKENLVVAKENQRLRLLLAEHEGVLEAYDAQREGQSHITKTPLANPSQVTADNVTSQGRCSYFFAANKTANQHPVSAPINIPNDNQVKMGYISPGSSFHNSINSARAN